MRSVIVILLMLFSLLQYKLWFSAEGLAQTLHLKTSIHQQSACNDKLAQKNVELLANTQRLKSSKTAMDAFARQQLGMIKNNETYYQFTR